METKERKQIVQDLQNVNRALSAVRECNQALIRATRESELLYDICRIIVEKGGYRFAWVGFAQHDPDKTVLPVAQWGEGQSYLERLNVTWSKTQRGSGPTGTAIRTGQSCIVENIADSSDFQIWRDKAIQQGFSSSISLPLIDNGKAFGALGIYSANVHVFDSKEVNLLTELVGDLSYGIMALRTRIENRKAKQQLDHSLKKLKKSMDGIIQAMSLTVETRDPYTAGHQRRVASLACAIAREMGLAEERIQGVYMGGLIHDLGKIAVPAEILSKPGKITTAEFDIIKSHPQTGYEILKEIEFSWPVAQIVLQHHERMDGSGYPSGLGGRDILLEAKIIAVADVVEAIASHRPYRPALGIDTALKEIEQHKGSVYDEKVVTACLKVFSKGKFVF